MKVCKTCLIEKSELDFWKHKKCADGLRPKCKDCMKKENKEWNENNKERAKINKKNWKNNNKDKLLFIANLPENRKKARERTKVYRELFPEKVKESIKKWKKINQTYLIEYRLKTKEYRAIYNKKWHEKNQNSTRIYSENRRARKLANGSRLSRNIVEKLYELQKGRCACCGKKLGNDYHLDHIMPLALGGLNEDSNMQLLKSKCNLQKHAKHPIDFMQSKGFLL